MNPEEIAEFTASHLEGSPTVVSCQRMPSGFANANYRLETTSGVFLLRDRLEQDRAEILYEIQVLDWLQRRQFPATPVIPFANGESYLAGPDDTNLVLLEWLEGSEPEPNHATAVTIARALADLHLLNPPSGSWWRRDNPIGLKATSRVVEQYAVPTSKLYLFYAEEFALLEDQLSTPLPRGLIHADLFPDNTLFLDDKLVAILDFECACEDTLLFDLVMTIHGFCFPNEQWSPELARTFVAAYAERRPLTEAEHEALPIYLRWCPLAMMTWHLQQMLLRPGEGSEKRAGELVQRIKTMKDAYWSSKE